MARRISILLFAFAFFATWLLLDSSSYNQLPSGSTSLPNPEALPEHSPRPPSSNPFHPTSCDPAAYTKDSIEHYLLTAPDDSNAPPWAGVNHEQFRSLCECLLTNSCLENQDKVVVLNVNHFGV
ncbi:hypothetical protein DL93DRAFT_1507124 [Clavulina sp. PMI_390]|nr:hypothetical protein DL93DRAFT_1507124 [Clavulina sp. PMI_390]